MMQDGCPYPIQLVVEEDAVHVHPLSRTAKQHVIVLPVSSRIISESHSFDQPHSTRIRSSSDSIVGKDGCPLELFQSDAGTMKIYGLVTILVIALLLSLVLCGSGLPQRRSLVNGLLQIAEYEW